MSLISTPKIDRPCQDLINAMYEASASWDGKPYDITVRRSNGKRRYLGMSGIGAPCERALWYGFRGFTPKPIEGKSNMIFEFGDHIEQIQIHWLEQAGYHITNRQDTYQEHNGYFRGHPDGIIHGVTSMSHAYDAKSCNKKALESLKKLGMKESKPTYYAQAQMMMHYSKTERAIYVFTCKDNCELYAERFYYNQEEAQGLIQKALRIIASEDTPPAIEGFNEDNFNCKWCDYNLLCFYKEESLMSDKMCGTCYYLGWQKNSVQPCCKHPGHPLPLKKWGISCPDYLYLYYKEPVGKKKYPDKVDI